MAVKESPVVEGLSAFFNVTSDGEPLARLARPAQDRANAGAGGMTRCIVWAEGVDFSDTLFDSNKISVIRGASRALEAIGAVVERELTKANLPRRPLTRGASQAAFLVDADEAATKGVATTLERLFASQGFDPNKVRPVAEDVRADLLDCAPFAHLKIHVRVVAVLGDDVERAMEEARAATRVAQMRDPGVRRAFVPLRQSDGSTEPCSMDRVRPAEMEVDGPTDAEGLSSEKWPISLASAARWHYGRALRQRLYERARLARGLEKTAFCDDFGELVAPPRPRPRGEELPVSTRTKMAVFAADGDGFTKVLAEVKSALGAANGLAAFAHALSTRMENLIETIAGELFALGAAAADSEAAVAWPRRERDSVRLTKVQRGAGIDRLHRFETLTLGGDDIVFVVPAWLGWWVVLRFFDLTKDWEVGVDDIRKVMQEELPGGAKPEDFAGRFPMRFSAGLVFCSHKTPIRLARDLADGLLHLAKDSGKGLEIEVLESVEPPLDGICDLRDRLLGELWRAGGRSQFTIARDEIPDVYRGLYKLWAGAPRFPASQAHRALRAARDIGATAAAAMDVSGQPTSGKAALDPDNAARSELEGYFGKAGAKGGFAIEDFAAAAPKALKGHLAAQLHFALQQRDYVRAGGEWTDNLAGLGGAP